MKLITEIRESADAILNFLKLEDKPEKVDAIFVAGSKTTAPVDKAVELFKKGFAKKIVFVGKTGTFTNPKWHSEAVEYHKRFLALGIPEKNLLWKPLSTNTLEESTLGISFMRKNGIKPNKIILVTKDFHQKRLFATFKKQFPNILYINIPADRDYDVKDELWRLVAEIERLNIYGKKGDIVKQRIPKDIKNAYMVLKNYLQ